MKLWDSLFYSASLNALETNEHIFFSLCNRNYCKKAATKPFCTCIAGMWRRMVRYGCRKDWAENVEAIGHWTCRAMNELFSYVVDDWSSGPSVKTARFLYGIVFRKERRKAAVGTTWIGRFSYAKICCCFFNFSSSSRWLFGWIWISWFFLLVFFLHLFCIILGISGTGIYGPDALPIV